jgi:DNA-binding transcriptional LysR family regulator
METITPRFEWAMTFLSVSECGSFTRASERMGCSKAYVSKQVQALERSLGVKLLHRTTRSLQPTESGAVYLEYCLRLRNTLSEAERAVSNMHTEVRGRVTMTVPTTFGVEFMGGLLRALHETLPEVEVDLDLSTRQRDLIAEGIDMAIRFSRTIDQRLIAKPLGVLQDWVVAAPAALLAFGEPKHPQDLAGMPCLSNSHFKGDDQWLFIRGANHQAVNVRHWLRLNNYPLMKQVALGGMGFAKLPAFLVQREVENGELKRVLIEYELPSTPIYLVFCDERPLPRKIRVTVDFVSEWFRQGNFDRSVTLSAPA